MANQPRQPCSNVNAARLFACLTPEQRSQGSRQWRRAACGVMTWASSASDMCARMRSSACGRREARKHTHTHTSLPQRHPIQARGMPTNQMNKSREPHEAPAACRRRTNMRVWADSAGRGKTRQDRKKELMVQEHDEQRQRAEGDACMVLAPHHDITTWCIMTRSRAMRISSFSSDAAVADERRRILASICMDVVD